jgi:hypothetical protein
MTHALTLRLQATLDLLKRYAAIFSHVWKIRRELDPPHRLPHEAQFLPAALELQETPVSPAPRIVAWLLMAFALIALLWAVFGRIDVVATAQGKIVPNEGSKLIQPIETAAVKAIHVVDGQAVKAGQVLVELDATMARADSTRTANDLTTATLQAARARGLLAALANGKAPRIEPPANIGAGVERVAQEQRILDGQYGEYQARVTRIDAEIAKREAERRSTEAIVRKAGTDRAHRPPARRGLQGAGGEELHLQARLPGKGTGPHRTGSRPRNPEKPPQGTRRRHRRSQGPAQLRPSPKPGAWRSTPSTKPNRKPTASARNWSRPRIAAG